MIRAKFWVSDVKKHDLADGEGYTVELLPVVDGSEENREFYKWTPGGNITLSTINEAAGKSFTRGQEFYVDFTPATVGA